MKRVTKSLIALLLVLMTLASCLPLTTFAATVKSFQTVKDRVPIWSEASSKSTKLTYVETAGTVLTVIGSVTNDAGNVFYELEDHTFVFSGNVAKCTGISTMQSVTFTPRRFETTKEHVPVWSEPHSDSTKLRYIEEEGTVLTVIGSTTNLKGNVFYELDDHTFVFSGNVTQHTCVGIMCSMEKKTYEYINEQTHKRIGTLEELCICRAVVDTTTNVQEEQHTFNGENLCACGFQKPEIHVHAYTDGVCACGAAQPHTHKSVACGEQEVSYAPNDTTTHFVIRSFPHLCSCGLELGREEDTDTEPHDFSLLGKCRQCDTPRHVCKTSYGGDTSVSYEQSTDTHHITATHVTNAFCDCGALVAQASTTLAEEKHRYGDDHICDDCGHQRHVCKAASAPEVVTTYRKSSPFAHEKVVTTSAEVCECGVTLKPVTEESQVEKHSISNHTCVHCGYMEEGETHTHKAVRQGDSYYVYEHKNSKVHYKAKQTPEICSCNTTISFTTSSLAEEAHTFVDRVCKYCGFKEGTGILDVDPTQMGQQVALGNYSDSTTIAGIVGELIAGELPYVGSAADIRDIVYDLQNDVGFAQTAIDAVALFPLAGAVLKYGDELADALKSASKLSDSAGDSISYLRRKAVKEAWELELDDVMNDGTGITRHWSEDEILELKSTGTVKGYYGHHMKSVKGYPELAGNADNIQFLTFKEHLKAHSGKWQTVTHGYFDFTQN